MLSERSQTPKATYSYSFHMMLWKTEKYREEKRSVVARALGGGTGRSSYLYISGTGDF